MHLPKQQSLKPEKPWLLLISSPPGTQPYCWYGDFESEQTAKQAGLFYLANHLGFRMTVIRKIVESSV